MSGTIASKGKHMVWETYPCGVRTRHRQRHRRGPAAVEVEQLWDDPTRWASWIDGFGHVVRLDDDWPQEGARRIWDSPPGGRGRVMETATALPRAARSATLAVEDERVRGVQRVRFESDGDATRGSRSTFDLEPEGARSPPARRWWLRRQFREALRRSLRRFSYELAADRER